MKDREKMLPYSEGGPYKGKTVAQVFQGIYENRTWQLGPEDSASGQGSSSAQTQALRAQLPLAFKSLGIKSFLDIPCGDFGWMQYVPIGKIQYIGADIVEAIVNSNQQLHARKNRTFQCLNLATDPLPPADLIFCRDCLVHLSFSDIALCLKNIKTSQAKYLMATHFTKESLNKEVVTGGWRPLNFCISPFNFPPPLLAIDEKCTELDGLFLDKSMAVWKIEALP